MEETLANPSFDRWAFDGKRVHPVSIATRLSFQDYSGMQTYTKKQSGQRRLETPQWAVNDVFLRELLVAYLENRAGIRKPKGTLRARRARVRRVAISQHPRFNATLNRLNSEYVQAQRDGVPRERLKELEIEIENLDTHIRTTRNGGMDFVAAVVYLYYRVGLDSVGVGGELGLRPPHVRQILWKLRNVWKARFNEDGTRKGFKPKSYYFSPRLDATSAAALRKAGMTWAEIAKAIGAANPTIAMKCVQRAGLFVRVKR
jgi:hypothetical protein